MSCDCHVTTMLLAMPCMYVVVCFVRSHAAGCGGCDRRRGLLYLAAEGTGVCCQPPQEHVSLMSILPHSVSLLPHLVSLLPHLLLPLPSPPLPNPSSPPLPLITSRCPVAVGVTVMSGAEMVSQGMKGKGVIVLHTHKDCLW